MSRPSLLVAPLLLGSTLLCAQTPQEAPSEAWSLPPLEALLKVKVRVASRIPQTTAEAPSSVTVFTQAEIRRMGIRTLGQLLNFVPGLQTMFEPHEGRTNLMLGRGTPEPYGQSFLLLLDGHRLNEHYTGGFTLANRLIPLDHLDRVEVIRGPGSALYGSNAFNGVIHLITARNRQEVTLEAGEQGAKRLGAQFNGARGAFAWSAFLQGSQDQGFEYRPVFDRFQLQASTKDPRQSLDGQVGLEYDKFFLDMRHTQHRLEDSYLFGRLSDGINEDFNAQSHARLGYRIGSGDSLSGTLALAHTRTRWEPFARLVLQGSGPFQADDLLLGVLLDHRATELTADFSTTWGDHHRINFGANVERADIPTAASRTNYDPIDESYLGGVRVLYEPRYRIVEDETRNLYGLYLQHQKAWTPTLSSTLGLRFDRYNDMGSSLNPRLALVYHPSRHDTLKLMLGTAFRAPGLGDLYDKDAGLTLGNPNLGPITVRTWELAYQHAQAQWQVGATGFWSHSENLLSGVTQPNGDTLVENIGHNDAHGVEATFDADLWQGWQLKLNATRILNNETVGIPDPAAFIGEQFAPKTYGSIMLNYRFGEWNFNLSGFWRDQIPVLPKDSAFWNVNLAATYRFSSTIQFQLAAQNLLDERHFTPARSSALGRDAAGQVVREVPQRGRQMLLRLTWRP